MKDKLIQLENVWVSYPESRNSIKSFFKREVKEFWALKNINFTINKGEVFGVLGRNGSGKSTLLKLLTGLIDADKGVYNLKGKKPILLSLGVGFEPELSGIENIYLNGLYLGYKKRDMDLHINNIIEFSELGDFIYKPIRTYSTGMRSRLAFSTAISLDPEILLVDEVLGVGDASFQEKSKKAILSKIQDNRTVVIVSHSASLINSLCNRAIWIHQGEQYGLGETKEIAYEYQQYMKGLV